MILPRDRLISLLEPAAQIKIKSTRDIVKTFYLSANPGTEELELRATDLETYVISRLREEPIQEEFTVCVPSAKLFKIVKELPERDLVKLGVKDGRFYIECGNVKYELSFMTPEEFPSSPSKEDELFSFSCYSKDLLSVLKKVAYAMSKEEARFCLCGVCFDFLDFPEKIYVVASDGHRLALVDVEEAFSEPQGNQMHFIIPAKAVKELIGILNKLSGGIPLRVGFSPSFATFSWKNEVIETNLSMRLIEGNFPDWRSIVFNEERESMSVPVSIKKNEILTALKRASIVIDGAFKPVVLVPEEGKLIIQSERGEDGCVGEAREVLEAIIEKEVPDELKEGVRLNAAYFIEGIKPVSEEFVKFSLISGHAPITIKSENYLALIMPIVR